LRWIPIAVAVQQYRAGGKEMIGYLEGRLMKKEQDRILLLVNQVGYEVLVPVVVMETLAAKAIGDEVSLYIYYYQTERQPKPVLIGFNLEAEKEFFQYFISVEAIGPIKAVKALNISVGDIAHAIESGDVKTLEAIERHRCSHRPKNRCLPAGKNEQIRPHQA
jgi:Holliday junction DNA helicase RuvA